MYAISNNSMYSLCVKDPLLLLLYIRQLLLKT